MGLTPLLAAAKEGHEVIFETLLRCKANLKARTNHGEDVRSLALRHGNMAVVNIIDRQSFHHQPNFFLRSEPGLLPDDSELNGIGTSSKVDEWLQAKNDMIPVTGIRDGPEAFAKLMSNQRKEGEPMNIPTSLAKQDRTGHAVGSPYHFSVTPNTPEGTIGSFEEHFFINCGRTVESASLHKQLQKVNSFDNDTNQSLQNHASGIPPANPTVASFLQELKLTKYLSIFEEQDVDFSTLLTLTDNDLKEVGISLFGPRRKIITALSRWKEEHSQSNIDCRALEKLKLQACQAEAQLHQVTSEVQQLQAQLIQEKDLRLVVEGCLMEEKAKRQEIYTRVCKLQEHWKHVEGEVEMLKALNKDMEKYLNLSEDQASKELHDKLKTSIVNLGSFAHQGTTGTNCILFGHQNAQSGNSSESSGNSSS